jgi:phosphoglycolate phosphatase
MARRPAIAAFDLDGTLHWTEKALVPAIQRAMEDMGSEPASAERINSLYGEPLEEFCRRLLGAGPGEDCLRFRRGIARHQRKTLPELGRLYPGVEELLERLSAGGVSMAIISNAGEEYIRLVLDSLGIAASFDRLLGADTGLSKAARLRGLLDSDEWRSAVMVGDRYHDLQAAASCGVPSIGCRYGYGGDREMDAADVRVDSVFDIHPSLEGLGVV